MDAKTYQAEFGRSLAPSFHPANISPIYLGLLMAHRFEGAKLVDGVKRALFYNKTDRLPDPEGASNLLELPFNMNVDDIHAMLGMEGEMGEISEILMDPNLSDEDAKRRLVDECGDLLWYMALAFMNRGISFEDVFQRNIDKLKARYPDKFTVELAVNRDLEKEAKVFH